MSNTHLRLRHVLSKFFLCHDCPTYDDDDDDDDEIFPKDV